MAPSSTSSPSVEGSGKQKAILSVLKLHWVRLNSTKKPHTLYHTHIHPQVPNEQELQIDGEFIINK